MTSLTQLLCSDPARHAINWAGGLKLAVLDQVWTSLQFRFQKTQARMHVSR
jgi:hypothetical protein